MYLFFKKTQYLLYNVENIAFTLEPTHNWDISFLFVHVLDYVFLNKGF